MITKFLFVTFLLISQLALASFQFAGLFGEESVYLTHELSADQRVSLRGSFLSTDFQFQNQGDELFFKGSFFGQDAEFSYIASSTPYSSIRSAKNLSSISIQVEQNQRVSFLDGKWLGRGVSLRIEKEHNSIWVSGFYASLVTDFRIYVYEEALLIRGYMRDNWVDLSFQQRDKGFDMAGNYLGKDIKGRLEDDANDLSDFIEMLNFGFYIPEFALFY